MKNKSVNGYDFKAYPVNKGDILFYKDPKAFKNVVRKLLKKDLKYTDCWIAVDDMVLVTSTKYYWNIFRPGDMDTKDLIWKTANPKLVQCKYSVEKIKENPHYYELYNDEK